MTTGAYLTPEAEARVDIDAMLELAGWTVQDPDKVNLFASQGVAVREFILEPPHGRADYLLFVDGQVVGVLEAKPAGTVLGVEFTPEQLAWLERIRDTIASSLAISRDDFAYPPFVERGGLGKAFELFGERLDPLLDELTAALAA